MALLTVARLGLACALITSAVSVSLSSKGPELDEAAVVHAEIDSLRTFADETANSADTAQTVFVETGRRPRLAIFLVGVQQRLLTLSKIEQVVAPTTAAGYGVDVYVEIVKAGQQAAKVPKRPVIGAIASPDASGDLEREFGRSLRKVGGTLAHFALLNTSEDVQSDFPAVPNQHRITQYSPYAVDETGRNVLRRFKSLERLMNMTTATRDGYEFVLVTRDDDLWLRPLHVQSFAQQPNASYRMFSKNCKEFEGINDKTLLFGREAAKLMLGRIYSDFWLNTSALDAKNAETHWKSFAWLKGVDASSIDVRELATADSSYVMDDDGKPYICQKIQYYCDALLRLPGLGEQDRRWCKLYPRGWGQPAGR